MQKSAARWLDRLELLEDMPETFEDFEKAFLSQYAPLDDESAARDRLKTAT